MKKNMLMTVITGMILILVVACRDSSGIDKTIVKNLELDKYLGKWYEIARFDNRFEKGLERVTAEYSLREDGKIKVLNTGYDSNSGEKKEAVGKAKIPDKSQPAHLKVSFFAFFYADYLVLELDEDYKWAVVGSSSDKYLWILSRSSELPENILSDIIEKIVHRGYDPEKLLFIKQ